MRTAPLPRTAVSDPPSSNPGCAPPAAVDEEAVVDRREGVNAVDERGQAERRLRLAESDDLLGLEPVERIDLSVRNGSCEGADLGEEVIGVVIARMIEVGVPIGIGQPSSGAPKSPTRPPPGAASMPASCADTAMCT